MQNSTAPNLETETENDSSSPVHPDFLDVRKRADAVLEFVDDHRTPPYPNAYEVWYAYAEGNHEGVTDEINSLLEATGSISPYDIQQIHMAHLGGSGEAGKVQDETGKLIQIELDAVLKLVQEYMVSNEEYSGSLGAKAESLPAIEKPEQLLEVIGQLIEENNKMRNETALLANSLEQSKSQIQDMRSELNRARENEMRDPITKLGNRRWFDSKLKQEFEIAKQTGEPLCLAMVDIDHFKRINDSFGHPVGDQVLKFFGSLLIKSFKGKDVCARYGGEEFAIILPGTTLSQARMVADSLRRQFEKTQLQMSRTKQPIGTVTASIGISGLEKGDTVQSLLKRADNMLYKAKKAGRNMTVTNP